MKKAVFFDFYQTLVRYDPPREQIIAAVLGEHGIEADPARFVGPLVAADEFMYRAMSVTPLGSLSPEQRLALFIRHQEILLEEAGLAVDPALIPPMLRKMQATNSGLALFDDVPVTLDRLRGQGFKVGLISNVDTDIADTLAKLGLAERLDVVMTSKEAGATKPDPAIFKAALEKAGVTPEEALFVGDQYDIDILGARGAGLTAVLLDRTGFAAIEDDCPRITGLAGVFDYLPPPSGQSRHRPASQ